MLHGLKIVSTRLATAKTARAIPAEGIIPAQPRLAVEPGKSVTTSQGLHTDMTRISAHAHFHQKYCERSAGETTRAAIARTATSVTRRPAKIYQLGLRFCSDMVI